MDNLSIPASLAAAIFLASSSFGQNDNIDWVNMYLEHSRINNVSRNFDLEITVSGNDIGDCRVTPPFGAPFDLIQTGSSPDEFKGDDLWSLIDPSGTYGFVIDPATGQDSYSVIFDPISSLEYIFVWSPAPWSTDVSLIAKIYWLSITTGQEIYVELTDLTLDQEIEIAHLPIGATNWQPASPLAAGHWYAVELKIEYGQQVVPLTTIQGDSFQFSSGFARGNSIIFRAKEFELSTDELPGGLMDFDVTGCTPNGAFAICASTGFGSHSFTNPITGSLITTGLSSTPFIIANVSAADLSGDGLFSVAVPALAAGLAHLQAVDLSADSLSNILIL